MNQTRRSSKSPWVMLVGAALACGGSNNPPPPPPPDAGDGAPLECGSCHAATSLSAAHPLHAAAGFGCSECHPVFTSSSHTSGPAVVSFGNAKGDIAKSGGLSPTWTAASKTCSNVYCHGGDGTIVANGKATTPIWTRIDGSQSQCDSCHGNPPAARQHVQTTKDYCNLCHAGIHGGVIDPGSKLHINGWVDALPRSEWGTVAHGADTLPPGHPGSIDFGSCNACHGSSPVGGAPFQTMSCASCHHAGPEPDGGTDGGDGGTTPLACAGCHATASLSAAHARHLNGTPSSNKMGCSECHPLFTSMSHAVGAPVVSFATEPGDIARTGGLSPTWSAAGKTCSNVYCHGGDGTVVTNGNVPVPNWTKVDGSQNKCDSCHGNPPTAASHVNCSRDFCNVCHAGMYQGGAFSDHQAHIDGVVDAMPQAMWGSSDHGASIPPPDHLSADFATCVVCHGDPPIPPAPKQSMNCTTCHE